MKTKWMNKVAQDREGFTLIELLMVVAILGILAAMVAVNLGGVDDTAKRETTRASIKAIGTAVETYKVRAGTGLPDSLSVLSQKFGEYPALLDKDSMNDSWGNAFQYKKTGKYEYEIRSAGEDGSMGTGDDLTN